MTQECTVLNSDESYSSIEVIYDNNTGKPCSRSEAKKLMNLPKVKIRKRSKRKAGIKDGGDNGAMVTPS